LLQPYQANSEDRNNNKINKQQRIYSRSTPTLITSSTAEYKQTPARIAGSSFGGSTGVVLHQPLNCSVFWKKAKKRQNMNGIPVCLGPKTENAPTWRSPRPLFWGSFLVIFQPRHTVSRSYSAAIPHQHPTVPTYYIQLNL